jgi:hypothetical protein
VPEAELNYFILRNQKEPRMRRHKFKTAADDDSLPVMVPRNDKSESLKANTRQGTLETVGRHDRDRTSGVSPQAGVVAGNDCGMAWVNPQIGRRPG